MAEEITNTVTQEPAQGVVDESNQELNKPEANEDIKPETEAPVEGQPVEGEPEKPSENVPPTEPTKPTTEELEQRLKEYELREEERKNIAKRLGVDDNEADILNLNSIEAQVENKANAVFVRMCSDYGVDANPANLQASLEQLKANDPAKYYDFVDKAKGINAELQQQKAQIANATFTYNVNKYVQENQQLIDNIPAFKKIVSDYCVANQGSPYIYNDLNNIREMALGLIRSGIEIGQASALQQKAKTDTTAVSGGVAVNQTPVYTSDKVWTRAEIDRMSTDEFAKHEKAIMQAYAEGKIQ